MNLPLIIGQAPARGSTERDACGVLVPFQGYSGERLKQLAGVERLSDHFQLMNLFSEPAPRRVQKGDAFDLDTAQVIAKHRLRDIRQLRPPVVFLMGRKVQQSFRFRNLPPLSERTHKGIRFIMFPHPSGISHWWNNRQNRERAAMVLRQWVNHG